MSRSRTSWYVLALALPVAACSSDDDGPPAVNLYDGYSSGSISVPARLDVTPLTPVSPASTITGYTISPALPGGMTFDGTTGAIGGTPTDVAAAQAYTVTATDGTNNDAESITISVRNPIVGLSADRSLTIVENIAGTPIAPEGMGVALTGTAPTATITAPTETETPVATVAAVLTATDASNVSATAAPDANDATADFVATVTIDDSELDAADTWDFAAQAPYDDDGLTPALPSFLVDTSTVDIEDGSLTLDVSFDDTTTVIGPFDSGSLDTDLRSVEPLTGTAPFVGFAWTALGEDFYTEVTDGAGNTEVFRFDADGAVGGGPILTEAFDLDDAVDGSAQILGAVGGQLIVTMDDPVSGFSKTYSYDPVGDALVQIADLNPGGSDFNTEFTALGGALYFVGADATFSTDLYRYTYGDGVNPATLERISSTSEGSQRDEPENLVILGGDLYFTALDISDVRRLYRFDPETDTQELLSDATLTDVGNLTVEGGALYATAVNAMGGEKLFVWDSAAGALSQISNLAGDDAVDDDISPRIAFQGQFYFVGNDGTSGDKLYRHNPSSTPQTIEQVSNTAQTGDDDGISGMTAIGGLLFFSGQNAADNSKLWVFNSSTGEISQVTNINVGDDSPSSLTPIGTTRLAFSALSGTDSELYIYDLNTGETVRAADVNNGASDIAVPIVEFGGRIVFRAENGSGAAFYAAD